MRFNLSVVTSSLFTKRSRSLSLINPFMACPSVTQTLTSLSQALDVDDCLCSDIWTLELELQEQPEPQTSCLDTPIGYLSEEARIKRAWDHWKKLGEPKLIVAPMVDNSELPFRLRCRKYGAEAAYTPMLHSRIFSENEKYRSQEFATCKVTGSSTGNWLVLNSFASSVRVFQNVIDFFRTSCHGEAMKDFYYSQVCQQVQDYTSSWKHVQRYRTYARNQRRKRVAVLRQDYCPNACRTIAFFAGFVLLVFSAVQTFFTIYPYYKKHS